MKELYDKIIGEVKECSRKQKMFVLPSTENYELEESEYSSGPRTISGTKYIIKKGEEDIVVTYESKDKDKTFEIKPDSNTVTVNWNKKGGGIESHSESWSDKV